MTFSKRLKVKLLVMTLLLLQTLVATAQNTNEATTKHKGSWQNNIMIWFALTIVCVAILVAVIRYFQVRKARNSFGNKKK